MTPLSLLLVALALAHPFSWLLGVGWGALVADGLLYAFLCRLLVFRPPADDDWEPDDLAFTHTGFRASLPATPYDGDRLAVPLLAGSALSTFPITWSQLGGWTWMLQGMGAGPTWLARVQSAPNVNDAAVMTGFFFLLTAVTWVGLDIAFPSTGSPMTVILKGRRLTIDDHPIDLVGTPPTIEGWSIVVEGHRIHTHPPAARWLAHHLQTGEASGTADDVPAAIRDRIAER